MYEDSIFTELCDTDKMSEIMKKLVFAFLFIFLAGPFLHANSRWGITVHVPSSRDFDYIDELGAGWVRIDFNWSGIEPSRKGSFSWGAHDAAVDEAVSSGKRVFGTIAYTPRWARAGGGHNEPPVNSSDWSDFVYECARRYRGRVSHWGMWNEPNLPEFWTGSMQEYVHDILIPGAQAVREADSSARVLGPELSDMNRLYTLESLEYILANAGSYIDIVTQHAYGPSGGIFFFLDNQVLPMLEELAPGKELWLTETGRRSDIHGEEGQADFYRQVCRGVRERDYIRKVFFYKLVDGHEPEDWGLLSRDYREKEAFHAYRDKIRGKHQMNECFIAGAVFGADAFETGVFRGFRDGVLLQSGPGRAFVSFYYRRGPFMADVISGNRALFFSARLYLKVLLGVLSFCGA